MSATSTTKNILLSTALAVPLFGFWEPVEVARWPQLPHGLALTQPDPSQQFESGYKIVDHKIVRSDLVDEVQVINSLLEIGNILFKNARSEMPAELKAKRAYFKSRYKKV